MDCLGGWCTRWATAGWQPQAKWISTSRLLKTSIQLIHPPRFANLGPRQLKLVRRQTLLCVVVASDKTSSKPLHYTKLEKLRKEGSRQRGKRGSVSLPSWIPIKGETSLSTQTISLLQGSRIPCFRSSSSSHIPLILVYSLLSSTAASTRPLPSLDSPVMLVPDS